MKPVSKNDQSLFIYVFNLFNLQISMTSRSTNRVILRLHLTGSNYTKSLMVNQKITLLLTENLKTR